MVINNLSATSSGSEPTAKAGSSLQETFIAQALPAATVSAPAISTQVGAPSVAGGLISNPELKINKKKSITYIRSNGAILREASWLKQMDRVPANKVSRQFIQNLRIWLNSMEGKNASTSVLIIAEEYIRKADAAFSTKSKLVRPERELSIEQVRAKNIRPAAKNVLRAEVTDSGNPSSSTNIQSGNIVVSGTGGPKKPKRPDKRPDKKKIELRNESKSKNTTASKGKPSEFPPSRTGEPTKANILQTPKDFIRFARTAGDVHRAVLNASWKSNIVKPVSIQIGHLATSSKALLNAKIMTPLKSTPNGAAFVNSLETMAGNAATSIKLLGKSPVAKTLGEAFNFMTKESVKAANGIKKVVPYARAATITALATASRQGTMVHRREIVGDPSMSREAKIIAKCANLPKGFVFEYMYTDKVEEIKQIGGHAFLVLGVNSPKVILPATGLGQTGVAQPVAAYKESENRASALLSGSAFMGSGTFIGQIGTPNLNMTYGQNLIVGRFQSTLPGIYAGVGPSTDPNKVGTMTKQLDVVGVLMFDLHTKHSYTTLNIGPIGFMVERKRDVQTTIARTGTDYTSLNPFNEGSGAVLSPLITLNSGYDASGKDAKSAIQASEKIWASLQGHISSQK